MHRGSPFVSAGFVALLLLSGGCGFLRQSPQAILPAAELYKEGERQLNRQEYEEARTEFLTIVERHPDSPLAPRARFLIGEAYYREGKFNEAVTEFEAFMALYPSHSIADLAQYRLAMSFYDQMKPVEQDQAFTRKAMEAFRKLVREYPESRYASDGLAKIDICRGRLAQKELWIAYYYYNKDKIEPARQRLEGILKEYSRTLVIPETLFLLAQIHWREGLVGQADRLFQRLVDDFSYTEWGRRAARRLAAQR
ncbi:MAG: outer membrane protein assembly factor BamD [Candidatus Methylomirabilia bacterium]